MIGAPFPPGQPSPPEPSLGTDGLRPDRRPLWRPVVRWVRFLVLGTVVGTALAGSLATHWMGMVLFAPGLGAFFAGVIAVVDTDFPGEPASRRAVAYSFASGVLLIPLANGLVMLGTTGGAVLVVLLVVGPFLLGDWMLSEVEPDLGALAELLPALTTATLLREWEATEDLLRVARNHATAAALRSLLLDELSRRDPGGVAAWLAAGGGSPADFIRADRDLAG
jgi:hypothetical protein